VSVDLFEILQSTTRVYRKGDVVRDEHRGALRVITIDGFPAVDEAPAEEVLVDVHFVVVGVNKQAAVDRQAGARNLAEQLSELYRAWCGDWGSDCGFAANRPGRQPRPMAGAYAAEARNRRLHGGRNGRPGICDDERLAIF
jgi:hypothetical protein